MKKFTKVFAMMLVIVMVVGMFSSVSFAAGNEGSGIDFTTDFGGVGNNDLEVTTKVKNLGGSAITIVQTVGTIVAIVMVFVYAIKWMMATPQKKQELKERLWYLAIGVVLLVGGPAILNVVANFGEEAFS